MQSVRMIVAASLRATDCLVEEEYEVVMRVFDSAMRWTSSVIGPATVF